MKTLALVTPVYKEAEVIGDFYRAVKAELSKLAGYSSTIYFVVDKSPDTTLAILSNIAAKDPTVFVIGLSSRTGKEMSILAGIDAADADCIVMMDCDLQHPPELIPKLIAEFEAGSDVVYTIRENTEKLGWFRKMQSTTFYYLFGLLSETKLDPNVGDYRLISKRVAEVMRTRMRERNMFLPGLINWMGFRQSAVRFVAHARPLGQTKFSFGPLLRLAIYAVISFSKKPIRAAGVVGLTLVALGIISAVATFLAYMSGHVFLALFFSIAMVACIIGGTQLFFLAVVGEYIGAIFDEVKGRPHYIVEHAITSSHASSAPVGSDHHSNQ